MITRSSPDTPSAYLSPAERKAVWDVTRVNKVVTVPFLQSLGLLKDTGTETLQALVAEDCVPLVIRAKRTAGSRQPALEVPALARSIEIARRPQHMLVQLVGLAAAKVMLGLDPLDRHWVPTAEYNTLYQAGRSRFVTGIALDGRYDEYGRDGQSTSWLIEYSHGEFERRRLREKIVALGPNPQLWVTPSVSHARVIRQLLCQTYPLLTHKRVIVVDWTGGKI